jgi:hypothetical protein
MGAQDDYQKKMDAQLHEWQAKIEVLKAKAEKAEAEQKIKYHEEIETLRKLQQQVEAKLDQLRNAGSGAWDELKSGVDRAVQDLQGAVESALDKFK